MKKRYYLLLALYFIFTNITIAQPNYATLTGRILDEKGEIVPFANIVLKETNNGVAADAKGVYRIVAKPGKYTVEVSCVGYEKVAKSVILEKGKITKIDFLTKGTSFEIGAIKVTAQNQFIPNSAETKTQISAAEIEHVQAASLGDIAKMLPGVETKNSSLSNTEKVQIRNGSDLGTQVVMDGVPVSNAANMQVGVGYSNAGSGVDLRAIPADNIKEVEVIRGVPSAQYGDLADGVMIVKTKASADPLRAKMKYNPQLYEGNLSGGLRLNNSWVLNGNFNVASSDRDVRIEGDGYTRIAAQISAENDDEVFYNKHNFYFTRAYDEKDEKPNDATRDSWYNRDMNFKYTGDYSYKFDQMSSINALASVSYTYQDSYDQGMVSGDNMARTFSTEEGTTSGFFTFGSYLGKKWIRGDVWNIYTDFNYKEKFFTGSLINSFVFGVNWKDDFNKGKGIYFDAMYPPTSPSLTTRPRTYNDLPQYNILSFYAEDKIAGEFFVPFTLQLGLRYESFRPEKLNVKGLWGDGDLIKSYNGTFLSPRVSFSCNITDDIQFRASYGTTAKAPPMSMIFAQKKYRDMTDSSVVYGKDDPRNFALVSTFIRDVANERLQGYTQKKYETSLDINAGFLGFTVTGYYNNSQDMFESVSMPTYYYTRSFYNWPKMSDYYIKTYVLESYSKYTNTGWSKVQGIEFAVTTKKIPVINTIVKIDGSYIYSQDGTTNPFYIGAVVNSTELNQKVYPYYESYDNFNKDLLINYRFDIQAKSLGMWMTLHIQQKLIEIDGWKGYDKVNPIGYYSVKDGEVFLKPEQQNSSLSAELKRNIQSYMLNDEEKPNKWLVNLKISKSLWKGSSVSFYVNNFFNNRPLYQLKRSSSVTPTYEKRNPEIFYGLEFNTSLGVL